LIIEYPLFLKADVQIFWSKGLKTVRSGHPG